MKKIILLSGALALLSATSCKEDYLQTEPTETVSVAPANFKLNGLYIMMAQPGTGGTTSHDDFGQKGYDIYSDLLSSDMVLAGLNYSWYSSIADYSGPNDFTNNINYKPWRYYYRVIKGANDIIDDLGGTDADTSSFSVENKHVYGQAKALRAYAYFYLLQLYTRSYDANAEAIPVYTFFNQTAQPKSTQAEVYNLIESDLNQAIMLLDDYSAVNKSHINKYVAKGLLSYAYAAEGKNAEAAALANEIVETSGFPVTTREEAVYDSATGTGGGFNSLSTPSWMWGLDITTNNDYDLISWWGQVDVFTYSYAWAGDPKTIDFGLYNSMRPDDIRRKQFGSAARPINKFYAPGREIGGQRTVTTDYVYMRVDEFHLLAAECYAKSGNEAKAKELLKNYLMNRLDDVAYIDGLSGQALQTEIYKNTRLEFWGEGKSYLAMKRNKATVTRGSNHLSFAGQSFSYDDDKLTLDIPQQEITDNPNF